MCVCDDRMQHCTAIPFANKYTSRWSRHICYMYIYLFSQDWICLQWEIYISEDIFRSYFAAVISQLHFICVVLGDWYICQQPNRQPILEKEYYSNYQAHVHRRIYLDIGGSHEQSFVYFFIQSFNSCQFGCVIPFTCYLFSVLLSSIVYRNRRHRMSALNHWGGQSFQLCVGVFHTLLLISYLLYCALGCSLYQHVHNTCWVLCLSKGICLLCSLFYSFFHYVPFSSESPVIIFTPHSALYLTRIIVIINFFLFCCCW